MLRMGVDIGGSKTELAVFTDEGAKRLRHSASRPLAANINPRSPPWRT
jgi:N-acetylglucosamine kinase-like BadF-type ATPase